MNGAPWRGRETTMQDFAPFLPLLGLVALLVTARRRRRDKKKRLEGRNGRT
jgi:uncharacterized protein (TIGR03382 family)